MYKTEFGSFDGDSWEIFCQYCFVLKYENEGYQEVVAETHGDLGIEGFTNSGLVFQCYCPDFDTNSKTLYESQRNKINKDLKKLETNEVELKKMLKENKIKKWIFVTPDYRNKDLISYCKSKVSELKKLDIIDIDFDILIHNSKFFIKEAPIALKQMQQKIEIFPEKLPNDEEIDLWKKAKIEYTDNALRKYGIILPNKKVEKITNWTVKSYLTGEDILKKWQERFPHWYEKLMRLISHYEKEVENKCTFSTKDGRELFEDIKAELKEKIYTEFPELHTITIDEITNRVVSEWILLCPIDFE